MITTPKIDTTHRKRGGSMGSFWTSNMWMVRCFAPELNDTLCCCGVYLKYKKKHQYSNLLIIKGFANTIFDCHVVRWWPCSGLQ